MKVIPALSVNSRDRHSSFARHLVKRVIPLVSTVLLLASKAAGGDIISDGKEAKNPPPEPEKWHFLLAIPGWIAWEHGQTGINGANSEVNVGPDAILKHTDMIAAFRAEASKGRFGIYGDLQYLSISGSIHTNGMLRTIDAREDEYLLDFGLRWRLIENEKGYLDVIAGSRYTNLYEKIQLLPNSAKVGDASETLARASALVQAVFLGRELRKLNQNFDFIPGPPLANRQPGNATRAIQAITGSVAEKQKRIQNKLHHILSKGFTRDDDWFDPYIGLRGHYNLNKQFYLNGRIDIGGFTVGSDFTSEAVGGIGAHLSELWYLEVNFKLLYVDYHANGFFDRTTTFGPETVLGVTF